MDWIKKILAKEGKSVAEQWRAEYQRQGNSYRALLAPEFDLMKNWLPTSTGFFMRATLSVCTALQLKYVQKDPDICERLLERALAVTERARNENIFFDEVTHMDHLVLTQTEVYANWIKTGILDAEQLKKAYAYALLCAEESKGDAHFVEGYLLQAARFALMLGDAESSGVALEKVKDWSSSPYKELASALAEITSAWTSETSRSMEDASQNLNKLFAKYRVPKPEKSALGVQALIGTLRFELGVLVQKMRVGKDRVVDLDAVYASVVR
jgi:hypothetical protein